MAARKLMQEVDKCFKKVTEGVSEFESIYEKIEQSNNPAQKEKLEDNLKREIKKLQRLRDQIKTWAASNDIKDKGPLLENRKLIETQMEKFKAVEKAMKTKAYSKEGLSAAAKLDPKEQAKLEAGEFLAGMVDELEQQVETLEAEGEAISQTVKKGKAHGAKAERMAEIERIIERHKWHQGKLELIRRSLENGAVEAEQVTDLEESIRYYVSDGMNDDFMEDEEMYNDLNLDNEEDAYGMNQEGEKGSSQDTQSIQEDVAPEPEPKPMPVPKARPAADPALSGGRRPSAQLKSPLPTLATLHAPLQSIGSNSVGGGMKPASLPPRPAEGLKYASAAAAAAAASEKGLGISPLPPPPSAASLNLGISPLPPAHARPGQTTSPAVTTAQPVATEVKQPTPQPSSSTEPTPSSARPPSISGPPPQAVKSESSKAAASRAVGGKPPTATGESESAKVPKPNGVTNGVKPTQGELEEESIYHLPSALQDLVESCETLRKRPPPPTAPSTIRMLSTSQANIPSVSDSDVPRTYRPDVRVAPSVTGCPLEPLPILDNPDTYKDMDSDTLFYIFYYRQGTHQQYFAAKALKDQSWRFHKQYQTWFQRHEEPKNITEEFEQGTYRFFDYESTWMNRRKADFRFAYKFLEDDV